MLEVAITSGTRPALRGDLDLLAVPALDAWLAGLDGQVTEVDLSGVTFFDSCALRTFLSVRRRNQRFRIVNPSPAVEKVLEMTGTLDYLVHGRSVGW